MTLLTKVNTAVAAGFALAICFLMTSTAIALQERPTSLDIVPQSASFYFASMNHEAQYKAVVESNAYQQLMETAVAKKMRKAYRTGRRRGWAQYGHNNPFADYLEGYSESIGSVPGKLAMTYLKQIFGNEVFVYGDRDWIEISQAMTNLYREAGESMQDIDLNDGMDEAQIKELLALARTELAGKNTPTLVIGTVMDEPSGVESLLQMAEVGFDQVAGQIPEEFEKVLDGFQVIEEDDMYLLSFQLESEMMPWEQVEDDPEFAPYIDDIKAILADKTFNLTVGIKGNFLVISVGPSSEHIKQLGKGDLLIDHPRLARLKQAAASHKLTSVLYNSEESAQHSYDNAAGIVDMAVNFAKMGIQSANEDSLDGLIEDIEADAVEMKSDMMMLVPKPGAYLGFSYIFERGIEGFTYNWAENKFMDDSKPLTILDHVGDHPAMVVAAREKGSKAQFDLARKWGGKLFGYVTKYAPRSMPNDEESEVFANFAEELRPILSKLADSTAENLLVATDNSQSAFVLDFTTARKSWHEMMPPSDRDLPIPAMAILAEHHDKEKIVETGASCLDAATEILELIREIPNSDVPDEVQISSPQHKTIMGGGDMYYYELPPQAGLDDTIAPHALVTDDLLILGYTVDQTERLAATSSDVFDGLLSDRSRPLMAAFYYDNRQVVNALHTWGLYGIQVARDNGESITVGENADNDGLTFDEPELMEALDQVVALLNCFESSSAINYMEDGAQVSHFQMIFQDVADK